MAFPLRFVRSTRARRAGTTGPRQRPSPRLLVAGAALLGAGLALLGGLAGVVATLLAVAVAAGLTAATGSWRLVRLALAIHASRGSYGPCRGAGFLGMGVLAAGLTVAALPALPAAARPAAAASGLLVTTAMCLLGMLLLPGAAPTPAIRLRRGLDGLGIGACLAFAGWVVLPPGTAVPPAALVAELAAVGGLTTVAVTAARAVRYRRAAVLCTAGAGAGLLGLTAVVVLLAYGATPAALLLAAVPLVLGPELVNAGARRAGAGAEDDPLPDPAAVSAGYPLLAVPVALVVVTALYRLLMVGAFDRTSVGLALAVGVLLTVREVLTAGDIRRYVRSMARHEAHFRSLVAGAGDLIVVLDEDLVVRWQSPAAARLFGLADADVVGHPFVALLHVDDAGPAHRLLSAVLAGRARTAQTGHPALLCARLRDGFGHWRDIESTVADLRDVPEVAALVLHVRDVAERRTLERTLRHLAFSDQLTGLPNRRELMRAIVAGRGATSQPGVLLAIDLDGLARVNDVHGREVGDAVLVEVGRRVRATVGPDDLPGRLGGDEFGVVTPAGQVPAHALGNRLLAELTRPYELPGAVLHLRASIGLAALADSESVDDLLERADRARRRAAQLGGNRVEWHDARFDEQVARRADVERELAGAIVRGELDLAFQPVVSLLDRRPVGIDAQLRWRHRTLGTVLPAELVPAAEQLGIAGDVGDWTFDAACRHLASWLATGHEVWIGVAVSPHQLAAVDFVERVRYALAAHGVPPARLVVQVPEGRLAAHLGEVVHQLAALRALGVRTALDDFGAGQAALAQLRRLPVDIVKVDFGPPAEVTRPDAAHQDAARPDAAGPDAARPDAAGLVDLGRGQDLYLVAKGLDTRSQLDEALTAGCRVGQGTLLGPAVPAERIEAYLEDHRAPSL